METPKFNHDCDNCEFLGRHIHLSEDGSYYSGKELDLYFCSGEPTVIARYGDEGSQYMSGMVFARPDGTPHLYEAKLRAIKNGLYKDEDEKF